MTEPACSTASAAVDEPLIGSAPDAVSWVCLEQNGPWGARAWTDSHLDADLGAAIESAAGSHGVRASLIRRPGRHADDHTSTERQLLVASTMPGNSWLLAGRIPAPETLLGLDWPALAAGDLETVRRSVPGLERSADPLLLVCTNGTRDTCCARLGRPVAAAVAEVHAEHVWEVTHTSGHRLAATTVLLPSGTLHGRVLDGVPILEAARRGELVLTGYRGRSTWPSAGQVAEEFVRREHGITGLDDLHVDRAEFDGEAWLVRHTDGRSWTVSVSSYEQGERPESCGKPAKPVTRYTVTYR